MLAQFQQHIDTRFSFIKEKKLLVAISGGIDSVALTHLLHQCPIEIQLAHCNFTLREKESDHDEDFVKKLADSLGIKVYTKQFDTKKFAQQHKLSIQMAARQLRYDWFKELCKQNKLDYIVTAHHLNDNLETALINFTRGTGIDGLIGIPEINDRVIRPLLIFSRNQIIAYVQQHNIVWREDASNSETKYIRNKVRHQIIPLLQEINPNLLDSFKQTVEYLKENKSIVNDTIAKIQPQIITFLDAKTCKIELKKIQQFSNPKAYLYQILKQYGFTEWYDVVDLLKAQSGKQLFSETHRLIKDRDHFLLQEIHTKDTQKRFLIYKEQREFMSKEIKILVHKEKNLLKSESDKLVKRAVENKNVIFVDAAKLFFPLELRKWQNGDYFYPAGMSGKKKLSKFFKDEKYSLLDKEKTWLLCSKNQIVWVLGKRLDNRFKITEKTKKIVQIECLKG